MFERFYRSADSRTMPGSGLGLSIVRAVAERHGGAVCAGNAEGGGAAFWFWVPVARVRAGRTQDAGPCHIADFPYDLSGTAQQRNSTLET